MRVRILSPSPGSESQYLTSFLVDGHVAIDAGCLGLQGEPAEQAAVDHVFLSHSHLDHVLSLPMFLENAFASGDRPLTVHANRETIETIRTDVFNGRLWPALLDDGRCPYRGLRFAALESERPVTAGDLVVTPVSVDHDVPTLGFLVDDGVSVVAFGSDSGPTDRIWEVARTSGRLRAVFLEATMPDRLLEHAGVCGHLTPALLAAEASKLPTGLRILAVHLSPRHRSRIVEELDALGMPGLEVGVAGGEYRF